MTYLLSRYREGRQFDVALKSEMDKLRREMRSEMRTELDAIRAETGDVEALSAKIAQLEAENARLKRRLKSA